MASVLSSTKTPRILLGRTGANGPMNQVADGLRGKGYRVTEWKSSRIGAHSTDSDIQNMVNDIDMVFLVVRAEDAVDTGGATRPLHRILVEAGLMQGKMDLDRVVLLVENSVTGLSADSGLSYIRFSPDKPDSALDDVLSKIRTVFPVYERDLHERESMADQARSDELRVPWLLVGVVLFAAVIPLLIALSAMARGDGGTTAPVADDPASETVRLEEGTVARGFMTGSDLAGSRLEGSAGQPESAGPGAEPGTTDINPEQNTPAAPSATGGGADPLLPATCEFDIRKDSLLDDAINCEGVGAILVEGRVGPWHNDLAAVVVGEGVIGRLQYELRSDGTTDGPAVLRLSEGTIELNRADARFGVSTIILQFSAQNQHVHLFQAAADGGQSATLTFSLDE